MDYLKIDGYGCTDIGHHRLKNEDYFEMNNYLYVLADGMGGHSAGEIASKLAVKKIMKYINSFYESELSIQSDIDYIQQIIHDAILHVNSLIYKKSLKTIEYQGMGTTIVIVLLQKPNTIHIANVGDSRAYLIQNNTIKMITEDHSVIATMIREGTITKNEAKTHPYRHHITRSIGTSDSVKPFLYSFEALPKDKILLCSDGLWDVLTDQEINDIMQKNISSKTICQELITNAKKLGSTDNITTIVLSLH
jgi:PPM family protein phosphatase